MVRLHDLLSLPNGLSRSSFLTQCLVTVVRGPCMPRAFIMASILARCSGVILSIISCGMGIWPVVSLVIVDSHSPVFTLSGVCAAHIPAQNKADASGKAMRDIVGSPPDIAA